MKKRIGISTKNEILYEKMRLLLRAECDVTLITEGDDHTSFSLVFVDNDTSHIVPHGTRVVTMGKTADCDINLPFKHEDVLNYISVCEDNSEFIELSSDGRNVRFGEELIKLTEVEFKLLNMLMKSESEFVSRDSLLDEIWGKGQESGVVNVYIHYLRQKLEKNGRKVIISSRKEGYGIDKKYRRGR